MAYRCWLGIGLGVAVAACSGGGPTHVEISGKSPDEGAATAARAICARDARCGRPVVTCSGGGSAGSSGSDGSAPTMTCVGTIAPVSYDDCYADASGDIAEVLTCGSFTTEQIDTLEMCFDMVSAQPCVTQAEVDARARDSEMGISPPPEVLPAACALFMNPPTNC
jgi:hypothetical protein